MASSQDSKVTICALFFLLVWHQKVPEGILTEALDIAALKLGFKG
jgi:hypothetical protein